MVQESADRPTTEHTKQESLPVHSLVTTYFFLLFNYCFIAKNLITYYTSELHKSNVSAARQVMIWQGSCFITPLLGALIADSY